MMSLSAPRFDRKADCAAAAVQLVTRSGRAREQRSCAGVRVDDVRTPRPHSSISRARNAPEVSGAMSSERPSNCPNPGRSMATTRPSATARPQMRRKAQGSRAMATEQHSGVRIRLAICEPHPHPSQTRKYVLIDRDCVGTHPSLLLQRRLAVSPSTRRRRQSLLDRSLQSSRAFGPVESRGWRRKRDSRAELVQTMARLLRERATPPRVERSCWPRAACPTGRCITTSRWHGSAGRSCPRASGAAVAGALANHWTQHPTRARRRPVPRHRVGGRERMCPVARSRRPHSESPSSAPAYAPSRRCFDEQEAVIAAGYALTDGPTLPPRRRPRRRSRSHRGRTAAWSREAGNEVTSPTPSAQRSPYSPRHPPEGPEPDRFDRRKGVASTCGRGCVTKSDRRGRGRRR